MAPQGTPPPDRDGQSKAAWPEGEPKSVRDAADKKNGS